MKNHFLFAISTNLEITENSHTLIYNSTIEEKDKKAKNVTCFQSPKIALFTLHLTLKFSIIRVLGKSI